LIGIILSSLEGLELPICACLITLLTRTNKILALISTYKPACGICGSARGKARASKARPGHATRATGTSTSRAGS
jgi:hypothetical protein